ncbi:MAG: hypothetical protein CMN76_20420 [Spirochaetaceae bacterium]|nr:hypothetical protein [Spirochaetaceae bacterium]|tara:strand:+ start:45860 stop:46534 length:675 start_codon:yes stop_codon:yes gene_type:complete
MKRFSRAFIGGLVLLGAVVLSQLAFGDDERADDAHISSLRDVKFDPESLQHGDLVFRNGNSFMSDRIVALSPEGVELSHVGILVRERDRLYVVHIIGDHFANYVRKESLKSFLDNSMPDHFCVTRYNGNRDTRNAIAETALTYFKQKRGFDYDMTLESPDELFCTELAWRAILDTTGKDISPARVPWRGKLLIGFLPFFRTPHFEPVHMEKHCPTFNRSANVNR